MAGVVRERVVDDLDRPDGVPLAGARLWFAGARLRTVPVSIAPVVVGAACAHAAGRLVLWHALAALIVSVGVQVGTNYANDYSDGIRGTDVVRVGPVRLVAQGYAEPKAVLRAALLSWLVAAVAGLALAADTSWWLVAVGTACIAAGWGYVGGGVAYGYRALGDLSVFLFFGLVAVCGTTYACSGRVTGLSVLASVPVGLLAVALLVANNLRDIPTDTAAGKRTLAMLLGDRGTRILYAVCIVGGIALAALCGVSRPWALLSLLAIPVGVRPVRRVLGGDSGRDLIASLLDTARLQAALGLLLAVGITLG